MDSLLANAIKDGNYKMAKTLIDIGADTSMLAPIIFNGKEEIVEIVEGGGFFVPELIEESALCPLIDTVIEFTKELGKGVQGSVFAIRFPGQPKGKRYVVKRINVTNFNSYAEMAVPPGTNVLKFLKKMKGYGVSRDDIERVNNISLEGVKPHHNFPEGEVLLFPSFITNCLDADPVTILETTTGKYVTIQPPSYMCDNPGYSEYYCSLLVASFYRKGECINFIDTFSFATCGSATGTNQYIFMEQIDTTLSDLSRTAIGARSDVNSLIIQLLFALEIMQRKYKLQHNDLHSANMFIEYITPDTMWGGAHLDKATYFAYRIDGVILYIPASPLILKIGDFGMSVKFKAPLVGDIKALKNEYGNRVDDEPVIPNTFTPGYDVTLAMSAFITHFPTASAPSLLMAEMLDVKTHGMTPRQVHDAVYKKVVPIMQKYGGGRLKIPEFGKAPLKNVTPGKLFKSGIWNNYRKLPPAGETIVFLGEL